MVYVPNLHTGAVLRVFDVTGRELRVLAVAGAVVEWDLRDRDGRRVAAGVYQVMKGTGDEGRGAWGEARRSRQVVVLGD